jgi:hypothetical protein
MHNFVLSLLACCWLLPLQVIAQHDPMSTHPRVMRYVSHVEQYQGLICYGLVLTAHGGIPATVYNLGGVNKDLCSQATAPGSPAQLKLAFSSADTVAWHSAARILLQNSISSPENSSKHYRSSVSQQTSSRRLILRSHNSITNSGLLSESA